MKSIVLATATRFLLPLLMLFSLFVLGRGHNEPGGGFIGGLVAAAAVALYLVSAGVEATRRMLLVQPHVLIGAGLLLSLGSGAAGLFAGSPFLQAQWGVLGMGGVETGMGTPLLFDFGVYLVVVGSTVLIIISLAEE